MTTKFTTIFGLVYFWYPTAVVGLIIAIVIDALNRHSFRRFAHIFQEGFERVAPRIANCDAPSSVVHKIWTINTVAAVYHIDPNLVCASLFISACVPVFHVPLRQQFAAPTPATHTCPAFEINCAYRSHRSTIALTMPISIALEARPREDTPAAKFLSGKIKALHRRFIPNAPEGSQY